MKTIVVDKPDREEINELIAAEEPKRGDSLKFIVENPEIATIFILIGIVAYMMHKRKESRDFAAKVLNDMFENKSLEELEREVEHEYGINIEVEARMPHTDLQNTYARKGEDVLRTFQDRALKSWGGKIDGDAFLNEIRGRD